MASVKVEKFIQASPTEVYRYFTNSTAYRDWMCDVATLQAHPGGHIYLCWPGDYYTSGEFIELENEKYIAFTWFGHNEPRQTHVEISLKKKKNGTLVKLAHRGIGKGKKWESIAQGYEKEWKSALENLASVLETGADLRITRRPMMGIGIAEFNEAIANELCVPVKYGVRIENTMNGMGAQLAGLQKNDVLVAIDDTELTANVPLLSVLSSKHAGDTVKVTFYRGPAKKTVNMLLSGRSIPTIPGSGVELSQQVEPIYRQYENQFEELLNNASEEECSYKPGPQEWSVKNIMAHLIHREIGWQNYASEIIAGHEGSYDDYGDNLQERIEATTSIFPTKSSLMRELKAHDAETLSMLAHLPDDFVTHRGRFWKLTFQAHQNSTHLQTHLEQIQATIESARKHKEDVHEKSDSLMPG